MAAVENLNLQVTMGFRFRNNLIREHNIFRFLAINDEKQNEIYQCQSVKNNLWTFIIIEQITSGACNLLDNKWYTPYHVLISLFLSKINPIHRK